MNLILVIVIVACLPGTSDGLVAAQWRVSGIRHCAKSSSSLSSRQIARSAGQESFLSSILTYGNIDTVTGKKNVKSILMKKLRSYFQRSNERRSDHVTADVNARNCAGSHELPSIKTTVNTANGQNKSMKQQILSEKLRRVIAFSMINILSLSKLRSCLASGGIGGGVAPKSNFTPFQGACIWGCLFILSATLHSAESAITKISPWKVSDDHFISLYPHN